MRHWLAIGIVVSAVLTIDLIAILVATRAWRCTFYPRLDAIARVVPGFLNAFLFTYYASDYRSIVDGIEFCCNTPVIEHVIWPGSRPPPAQKGRQTVRCSLVVRLPEGRSAENGRARTFRNVSIHVPVAIELDNQETVWVRSVRQTETILYIGIYAQTVDQASLVGMFGETFATFNLLAPLDTGIHVE